MDLRISCLNSLDHEDFWVYKGPFLDGVYQKLFDVCWLCPNLCHMGGGWAVVFLLLLAGGVPRLAKVLSPDWMGSESSGEDLFLTQRSPASDVCSESGRSCDVLQFLSDVDSAASVDDIPCGQPCVNQTSLQSALSKSWGSSGSLPDLDLVHSPVSCVGIGLDSVVSADLSSPAGSCRHLAVRDVGEGTDASQSGDGLVLDISSGDSTVPGEGLLSCRDDTNVGKEVYVSLPVEVLSPLSSSCSSHTNNGTDVCLQSSVCDGLQLSCPVSEQPREVSVQCSIAEGLDLSCDEGNNDCLESDEALDLSAGFSLHPNIGQEGLIATEDSLGGCGNFDMQFSDISDDEPVPVARQLPELSCEDADPHVVVSPEVRPRRSARFRDPLTDQDMAKMGKRL